MRVRYTSRARGDLDAILDYIDSRSPRGAMSVKRAVRKTIQLIGEFPNAGRRTGEQGTQVLPAGHYSYLIYWIVENNEAWLLHIRHAHRIPWNRDKNMADPFDNPFATFTEWNDPSNDIYNDLLKKPKKRRKKKS